MDNKVKKVVDDFLVDGIEPQTEENVESSQKTIKTKDGLIERVNKKMVTDDGRTLLMG